MKENFNSIIEVCKQLEVENKLFLQDELKKMRSSREKDKNKIKDVSVI